MSRDVTATAIAAQVTMTDDMAQDYEMAPLYYAGLFRKPPYTRYNDPGLRTVHEVAYRALNSPTSHMEVVL